MKRYVIKRTAVVKDDLTKIVSVDYYGDHSVLLDSESGGRQLDLDRVREYGFDSSRDANRSFLFKTLCSKRAKSRSAFYDVLDVFAEIVVIDV